VPANVAAYDPGLLVGIGLSDRERAEAPSLPQTAGSTGFSEDERVGEMLAQLAMRNLKGPADLPGDGDGQTPPSQSVNGPQADRATFAARTQPALCCGLDITALSIPSLPPDGRNTFLGSRQLSEPREATVRGLTRVLAKGGRWLRF
jgi:hypothetical protein